MAEQTEHGRNFESALANAGIAPAELARRVKVNPQRITHWKARGVSARCSNQVAAILEVSPSLISKLSHTDSAAQSPNSALAKVQEGEAATPGVIKELSPGARERVRKMANEIPMEEALKVLEVMKDRLSDEELARVAASFSDTLHRRLQVRDT